MTTSGSAAGVVVVDASLALKWTVVEQDSDIALDMLREWERDDARPTVPSWFSCELANVLFRLRVRGELTMAAAQANHDAVMQFVTVSDDNPEDARRAMEIAEQTGQKAVYDAQYVALAERLGCELWTADDRFVRAVGAALPFVHALSER